MHKFVFIAVAIGVFLALMIALTRQPLPETNRGELAERPVPEEYQCETGERVLVQFNAPATQFVLTLPDGRESILSRTSDVLDERFQSEDLRFTALIREEGILIEEEGRDMIGPCVSEAISSTDSEAADTPSTEAVFRRDEALLASSWEWVETEYQDGRTVTPNQSGVFILNFTEPQQVAVRTDCNNLMATYELEDDQEIRFGEIASTLMYCEDSQETDFSSMLRSVVSYDVEGTQLRLRFENNEGAVHFVAVE